MSQEPTFTQLMPRSIGVTVFFMTAVAAATLAYTVSSGGAIGGRRQTLVVISLLLAAVAALTMTVDSFDLWMLGRRIPALVVRIVHWLVFVAVVAAAAVSVVARTPGLLLVMIPAVGIYLFATMRRQPATRRRAAGREGSARRARQKRGGKKRS